ncbi:fatty acid desaturase [Bacillus infantis]|uniref:fatty acid desaturase n=1 Tax=Bacillus TaxID=1386 RepID=UPI001CD400B4|nr:MULTISPECIES: fatty acid desaturase [Bacillus]MCA1038321.1 fatty acid desaturase [Bacillus infantis]MDT0163303.1 fatty acid desaturase [Bacillus sp. AG4(2022)]
MDKKTSKPGKLSRKNISPYEKADTKSSIVQLINTLVPFFLIWYLAYETMQISYLITLILTVVNAGFLVRIFIIFHDCCHNSFFKSKKANEVLGMITGVMTLFPFHQWRHSHSVHHATSGNLNKRGTGDIWVMTVDEYMDASLWQRVQYRAYRNPLVMFGLGPIYEFLIAQRFNRKGARPKEKMNTYVTNILIVLVIGLMCWLVGWKAFLLIQGPIFYISGALGIWLFYVQHQFEDTYFEYDKEWEFVRAAVDGSSFYKLPKLLQWLTGNIGFHHVHHLSPRVPNYYLEDAHNKEPLLKNVQTITLSTSLKSLKYRLWDEQSRSFVTFRDIHHLLKAQKKKSVSV